MRRCNKARFLHNSLKKTPSLGKSVIRTYSIFLGGVGRLEVQEGWGWGKHLFEVGANSGLGAYSNKYGKPF